MVNTEDARLRPFNAAVLIICHTQSGQKVFVDMSVVTVLMCVCVCVRVLCVRVLCVCVGDGGSQQLHQSGGV